MLFGLWDVIDDNVTYYYYVICKGSLWPSIKIWKIYKNVQVIYLNLLSADNISKFWNFDVKNELH